MLIIDKFDNFPLLCCRYGDLIPRSILGRIIAMIWFLVGLILNGIVNGSIVSSLAIIGQPNEIKLYNTKVRKLHFLRNNLELLLINFSNSTNVLSMYYIQTAALYQSFEYQYAVRKNAKVDAGK